MSTAEQKGKELIEKFRDDPFTSQITTAGAIQCALICAKYSLSLCSKENEHEIKETIKYLESVQ